MAYELNDEEVQMVIDAFDDINAEYGTDECDTGVNMTVRIKAGKIVKVDEGVYKRKITILDCLGEKFERCLVAETKEELDIIDHENFMKE